MLCPAYEFNSKKKKVKGIKKRQKTDSNITKTGCRNGTKIVEK